MGLSRDQMLEKKEATAEDVALISQTLWQRADDIPCEPPSRLSFHAMLLSSGGGREREVSTGFYSNGTRSQDTRDKTRGHHHFASEQATEERHQKRPEGYVCDPLILIVALLPCVGLWLMRVLQA